MLKFQLALFRIASRLHLWTLAVLALSSASVPSLDQDTRLRLSYACILAHNRRVARNAFAYLLRRNRNHSASDNLWLAYTAWCFGRLPLSQLINRRTAALYPDAPEAATAQCEAAFAAAITSGTLKCALKQALASLSAPGSGAGLSASTLGMITVVPLSSRYLPLFHLWHAQLQKHAPGPLLLLALDPAAAKILPPAQTLDLSPYFGFDAQGRIDDYSKRHLWILRVFLLRALATRGYTVLSLDLDAIFVGDLAPLLAALPPADIVVQQDYSIPIDVARKLGFILCCGFLLIRPSPAVLAFLDRYVEATVNELDDQTALNHLVLAAGLRDKQITPTHMSFRSQGLTWVCPTPGLISRDIDRGTVLRHFQQTGPLEPALLAQRLGIS